MEFCLNTELIIPRTSHPLFEYYVVLAHDELGILKITGIGKTNENDKYGQAVRGAFDRVVKSLDGKYGADLRHIVNESVSGDRSGIAQTLDYLKPSSVSSVLDRDDFFLETLRSSDRVLAKYYFLEGYDPLSTISVAARARSSSRSYLTIMYQATSYGRILKEAQSAQDDEAF